MGSWGGGESDQVLPSIFGLMYTSLGLTQRVPPSPLIQIQPILQISAKHLPFLLLPEKLPNAPATEIPFSSKSIIVSAVHYISYFLVALLLLNCPLLHNQNVNSRRVRKVLLFPFQLGEGCYDEPVVRCCLGESGNLPRGDTPKQHSLSCRPPLNQMVQQSL